MKTTLLFVMTVGMCLLQSVSADDKADVAAIAKDATTKIVNLLKDEALKDDVRKEKVREEITKVFDFPLTAKLTLGRAYWPTFNEAQRKEFQELFVRNIINSYYDKAIQFADETIIYEEPTQEKNKIFVAISFVSKGEKIRIDSKFYKKKGDWMIYDMEIQGVSIVRSYSSQYTEVLKTKTPDELIAKMRSKLENGTQTKE